MTRSSPKGTEGQTLVVKGRLRTLSSDVESRKFNAKKRRSRNVHFGCIVPYTLSVVCSLNISRRGLSRVAYPWQGDARALHRDKRSRAPTSFRVTILTAESGWL